MTKELERFSRIEPPTADESAAPDPFLPPPEKRAPIILDLSDQEHRASQQAAREAKAQQALAQARQELVERQHSEQLVGDSDDRTLVAWRATARWPVPVRLGAMSGVLGLTAILALTVTPIFWLFAPIIVAWFGTTFFVRTS